MPYDNKKAFQIWQTVCKVPAGRVSSYGFVADLAGLPGRARLVGRVLQFAPEDMAVPWYRIIKSNGQLAFGKGSSPSSRQALLLLQESVVVVNNRVNLKQFAWQPSLAELMELEF